MPSKISNAKLIKQVANSRFKITVGNTHAVYNTFKKAKEASEHYRKHKVLFESDDEHRGGLPRGCVRECLFTKLQNGKFGINISYRKPNVFTLDTVSSAQQKTLSKHPRLPAKVLRLNNVNVTKMNKVKFKDFTNSFEKKKLLQMEYEYYPTSCLKKKKNQRMTTRRSRRLKKVRFDKDVDIRIVSRYIVSENRAARYIQNMFRQRMARKEKRARQLLKRAIMFRHRERTRAAKNIQRRWRLFLQKKRVRACKRKQCTMNEEAVDALISLGAPTEEAHASAIQPTKRARTIKLWGSHAKMLETHKKCAAAKCLQRSIRAFLQRLAQKKMMHIEMQKEKIAQCEHVISDIRKIVNAANESLATMKTTQDFLSTDHDIDLQYLSDSIVMTETTVRRYNKVLKHLKDTLKVWTKEVRTQKNDSIFQKTQYFLKLMCTTVLTQGFLFVDHKNITTPRKKNGDYNLNFTVSASEKGLFQHIMLIAHATYGQA